MKNLLYGTKSKRVLMRAIESFLVMGFFGLLSVPEVKELAIMLIGTPIGMALLKTLRELKENDSK